MYKINWEKYLSIDRARSSQKEDERQYQPICWDYRNPFDSDFGRVVFCSAARRMHDKTQVFPLTSGDNVHTRLTHSIEVLNIAQSLGMNLCRNEDFIQTYTEQNPYTLEQHITPILRTAALMHDIGNPPFGHYGEQTIQSYFKENKDSLTRKYIGNGEQVTEKQWLDFCEFDGNAEGFRILTKLQYLGDLNGLNLTYATLGAYLKYPNVDSKNKNGYIGNHKHGIFDSETGIFNAVVQHCNLNCLDGTIKRHPLTFLIEAADTICYTAMDLEDGLTSGYLCLDEAIDSINKYVEKNADHAFMVDMMKQGPFDLKSMLKIGDVSYQHKTIVNFRVALIQYLVDVATRNFIENLEAIDNGTYNSELLYDDPLQIAKAINKYLREHLYNQSIVISAELTGAAVICGLLDIVLPSVMSYDGQKHKDKRIFGIISTSNLDLVKLECKEYLHSEDKNFECKIEDLPPYYRLRLVVDWISGMTDKFALETYQKLSGIKL